MNLLPLSAFVGHVLFLSTVTKKKREDKSVSYRVVEFAEWFRDFAVLTENKAL